MVIHAADVSNEATPVEHPRQKTPLNYVGITPHERRVRMKKNEGKEITTPVNMKNVPLTAK